MEARNVIVGRETRAYDDLHAAEVLLQVRENEVQAAKDDVAVQRRAAAEHLVTMRELVDETRAAKDKVRWLVDDPPGTPGRAVRARQHDRAILARLHAAGEPDQAADPRAGPPGRPQLPHRLPRHHRRLPGSPVNGPVTSSFGYREHPIYHYWGLHDGTDFGAGCGQPLFAAAGGTVMTRYYSVSPTGTASTSTSAW